MCINEAVYNIDWHSVRQDSVAVHNIAGRLDKLNYVSSRRHDVHADFWSSTWMTDFLKTIDIFQLLKKPSCLILDNF